MMQTALNILNTTTDFFLPRQCYACNEKLEIQQELVHEHCKKTLKKYQETKRRQVQRYLATSIRVKNLLTGFSFQPDSTVQRMIHRLKYEGYYRLGNQLGKLLWDKISDDWDASIQYIVPIPLHFARQAERGYNQATEIAKGLSVASGVPLLESFMYRKRYTITQTSLSREERRDNVKGAFSVSKKSIDINSTVLLLDDVITTGSTMKECVETLSKNGFKNVYACSFALV